MQSLLMFWHMCAPAGTHLRDKSTSKLCIYLLTFDAVCQAQVSAMQPASKYHHVTRRRRPDKPWQAMVRREYLGTFATEEKAAQAAADKLSQPKKTLLRSHQAKPPKRSHRFVYWHRTESKWQVKIGTQHYGNFAKYDKALAMATKKSGLTIKDLQLHPDCVRKSVQGQGAGPPWHSIPLLFWGGRPPLA